MLSVNPIARVVVNAVRSSASPASFDTGLLLIKDTNYADSRRLATVNDSAAAVDQLTTWGFASSSEPYKAAVKYFAASPSPSRLLLSCYPSSETLVEALTAVLDVTASFYGVALGQTETDARILALEEFISGLDRPLMLFVPVIGVSDAAALMGTAMGLELSHPASAFALCYKTINGIQPSALTETEATAIKALNGNVYLTRGYTHLLLEKGTVSSGARYDEMLYLDKIADDLQNAAVTLLAENPDRMPQTDDSTAQFINCPRRTTARRSSSTASRRSFPAIPTGVSWPPASGAARTPVRCMPGTPSRTGSPSGQTPTTTSPTRTGRRIRPCRSRSDWSWWGVLKAL